MLVLAIRVRDHHGRRRTYIPMRSSVLRPPLSDGGCATLRTGYLLRTSLKEAPVARYAVCASFAPFDRIATCVRTMRIKGPGVGDSAAVLTIGVNAAVGKSTSIMCNLRLHLLVRIVLFMWSLQVAGLCTYILESLSIWCLIAREPKIPRWGKLALRSAPMAGGMLLQLRTCQVELNTTKGY